MVRFAYPLARPFTSNVCGYCLHRQQGVRLLTFYLYLNDVEEGGGTEFDQLGVTVTPKRGRAALWPSVKNDNPNQQDGRTTHQALPVAKGVKYGGKNDS